MTRLMKGPWIALALLAACGTADAPPTVEPVIEDSAGVVVATFPEAALEQPAPFRLADEPSLVIGVVDGETEYQWSSPVSAVRLEDGRVAVLERTPAEIRLFESDGTFVRRIGGPGEGPGEFANPAMLALAGPDTLLVWDSRARRLSWFTVEGTLVRERSVQQPGGLQGVRRVVAAPAGGAFFVGPVTGPEVGENEGRTREQWAVVPVPAEGEPGPVLAEFPGAERDIRVQRADGEIMMMTISSRWWWGEGFSWGAPDGIWTAERLSFQALHVGMDGPDLRVRIDTPGEPFTDALVDSVHRAELAELDDPQMRTARRNEFAERDYPAFVPPIGAVFGDQAGRVWFGRTDLPNVRLPSGGLPALRRWLIVDPEPSLVGALELPELSHPLWADADGVLLLRNDPDFGVAFIEWYAFVETDAG